MNGRYQHRATLGHPEIDPDSRPWGWKDRAQVAITGVGVVGLIILAVDLIVGALKGVH